ncbi:MAG: glycosyltransferase family 39 protein [Pseudomonadota bacterium]
MTVSADRETHYLRLIFVVISGLLLLRLALVVVSPMELYADEAQYWRWSTSLDWGYYSKPPMIAWVIALSTSIFGDSEWAIRILAPVLHTFAVVFLYLLAKAMFGSRAGWITVIAYLIMPGITLSSSVISTDGVLFPFWCLSLLLLWRLREGEAGWLSVIILGVAIGAGFLSKYAMLYFAVGMGLASVFDPPTRRAIISFKGAVVGPVAFAVLSPHLIWNAANDFATVGHTVDNANLGGQLFNWDHLPEFITDQMSVFGPVSFVALIAALVFLRPRDDLAAVGDPAHSIGAKRRWLACFVVPVLIIIAFQAVLSRAHANWAATAYPAACLIVASLVVRRKNWAIAFWIGIGINAVAAAFAGVLALSAPSVSAALGQDNAVKRVRGWQDLSDQLIAEVERIQPTAILLDEREIWHGIDYYTRDRLDVPLILWRYHSGPKSFAETVPMSDAIDDRVLVASYRPEFRPRIKADFQTWDFAGEVGVDLGHRSNGCPLSRDLRLYLVSDFEALERTAEWVERFQGQEIDGVEPCPKPEGEKSQ